MKLYDFAMPASFAGVLWGLLLSSPLFDPMVAIATLVLATLFTLFALYQGGNLLFTTIKKARSVQDAPLGVLGVLF